MKQTKIVGINFRLWRINPKNMAALLCLALYTYDQLHGMADLARFFHSKVTPWVLPFLLCSANRFIPVMFLFLLLISDAPFRTKQQRLVMLRTGKRAWIVGQLIYLILLSVGFAIMLWIFSWVWYLPELIWDRSWGSMLLTASQGIDPGLFGVFLNFGYRVMKNTVPISVSLWCSVVMILVCYMLGVIMTICNLWMGKGIGAAVTSTLVGISLIPQYFTLGSGIIKMTIWISPVSWMDRTLMGNSAQNLPSYAFGIWMPLLISLVLSLFLILTIGKCNVETDKE